MTSISKIVYIEKLDDIINEYNNTYHSIIKMKSADVNSSTCIDFNVENNDKNPELEVGDHARTKIKIHQHQNTRAFWEKVTLQIDLKKFLWIKGLKILCGGHM